MVTGVSWNVSASVAMRVTETFSSHFIFVLLSRTFNFFILNHFWDCNVFATDAVVIFKKFFHYWRWRRNIFISIEIALYQLNSILESYKPKNYLFNRQNNYTLKQYLVSNQAKLIVIHQTRINSIIIEEVIKTQTFVLIIFQINYIKQKQQLE